MVTILYFKSPTLNNASTEALIGAREIAARFSYLIRDFDGNMSPERISGLIEFWKPAGIIVESGEWSVPLDATIFGDIPTVFIDRNPDQLPRDGFAVMHDSLEAGRMAARELLSTDYRNFAFVPFPGKWRWNAERLDSFSSALSLNGFDCTVFSASAAKPGSPAYFQRLRKFIFGLPKPCAIFAANDRVAADVIAESAALKLNCPDDVAVIGVDDFEPICEYTRPRLTSIRPDFRRGGELAALMIAAIRRDGKAYRGDRIRRYCSFGVIRRESTLVHKGSADHESFLALELIRNRACQGLTANEVLKVYSCSRALAVRRFKAATGNTILHEIHVVQLARVKSLLADPSQRLEMITDLCGFTNPNSLRKFFLRETGLTMSHWRKKHFGE